jgi:histidinol-phosphate aminotransferase
MSRFFDLVSKPAREMDDYSPIPGAVSEPPTPLIKLDSNENPFGAAPRVIDAMRAAIMAANFYPDDDCSKLRRKIASWHDLHPGQVLVTAGSTALLGILCQTLLAPGLNAITSERSFIVYSLTVHATGARLIETPTLNDGFDLDAILAAIDANTRIVFLANPNNPTGTVLDAPTIERFVARVPAHVVVVLDEAYYEFAKLFAAMRGITYSGSLEYVRQGAGVVILRTFSKVHGLAGLRVGYGLGPPELLGYCARMRNTFSVSSLAQAAALAAMDQQEYVDQVAENNAAQAEVLAHGLSTLGFRVVPTWANFVYCELGEDAAAVAARLRNEGVSVRPLGAWGAPTCIRVTIGTPEQNQFFLNVVQRVGRALRA